MHYGQLYDEQVAASYGALVGEPVVPTFEIITTVASSGPGSDGNYSNESAVEKIRPWVDAARAAGAKGVPERATGAFNLGRFDLPVAVAALVWIVLALFVLVTPDDALIPSLIVIGLILIGAIYFAWMMIFNREVLESEPGDDEFAAAPKAAG